MTEKTITEKKKESEAVASPKPSSKPAVKKGVNKKVPPVKDL